MRRHQLEITHRRPSASATTPESYPSGDQAAARRSQHSTSGPALPRIDAPTLVIAGADDPATRPVHAQAISGLIPAARLRVLDGAAHLAGVQQATAVTRLIADHLDSRRET
jgi:3-oxoadipate enol-lactonase